MFDDTRIDLLPNLTPAERSGLASLEAFHDEFDVASPTSIQAVATDGLRKVYKLGCDWGEFRQLRYTAGSVAAECARYDFDRMRLETRQARARDDELDSKRFGVPWRPGRKRCRFHLTPAKV